MRNIEFILYTMRHKHAIVFVINKIVKDGHLKELLLERVRYHDLDKVFLYTLIDKKSASTYHKRTSSHHMEKDNETNPHALDFMEAVLDFESAGYTKADKPLNAYDTLMSYDYRHKDECLAIMKEWGIDESYRNTPDDPEWRAYTKTLPEPDEESILYAVYDWAVHNPKSAAKAMAYAKSVRPELGMCGYGKEHDMDGTTLVPIDLETLDETICNGEPVSNFRNPDNRNLLFQKEMELAEWHRQYGLGLYEPEAEKLTEILGTPTYRGKNPVEDVEFFTENCIWGYLHEESNGYAFLYLSSEGLSLEVTEECEEHIIELLDEFINKIRKPK